MKNVEGPEWPQLLQFIPQTRQTPETICLLEELILPFCYPGELSPEDEDQELEFDLKSYER